MWSESKSKSEVPESTEKGIKPVELRWEQPLPCLAPYLVGSETNPHLKFIIFVHYFCPSSCPTMDTCCFFEVPISSAMCAVQIHVVWPCYEAYNWLKALNIPLIYQQKNVSTPYVGAA